MKATDSLNNEPLNLDSEELTVLSELLESGQARLLVEIRHAHHRVFRDQLRQRLTIVENLLARCTNARVATAG